MLGKKDVLQFGGILLALFVIMVVAAVFYIGAGYLKETACEQGDTGYTWSGSVCQLIVINPLNESDITITNQDITAITKITVIETVGNVLLGLLTLVVVIATFGLIIETSQKFSKGF